MVYLKDVLESAAEAGKTLPATSRSTGPTYASPLGIPAARRRAGRFIHWRQAFAGCSNQAGTVFLQKLRGDLGKSSRSQECLRRPLERASDLSQS